MTHPLLFSRADGIATLQFNRPAQLNALDVPTAQALLAAVHLHGLAGDRVCAAQGLDSGLLADELAPAARACFNAWVVPSPADAPQRPAE